MKIALGVSGGIAAYKAAELVRLFMDRGVSVQVVMTRAATEFVCPLTFAALSGQKVITEMFDADANLESAIEHIAVAQEIDALVVAPATANMLAKLAHGISDEFLPTLYLATRAPVIVAPAMNVNMWEHTATQENLDILRARGVRVVEPGSGYLACGMVGAGRLADLASIVDATMEVLAGNHDLAGESVLVTAGPTREPIDPVRYISNRSSGKMGYAIAERAQQRGAKVILISGPVALKPPAGVTLVQVDTAEAMRRAVLEHAPNATTVIKAAAVSDYRPKHAAADKIKRKGETTMELEPTTDIVAELASQRARIDQVVIGFAAETSNTLENARRKLETKKLDAIVLNDVSQPGIGFDSDRNAVTLITRDEQVEVAETTKREVADRVLDLALKLRASKSQGALVGGKSN